MLKTLIVLPDGTELFSGRGTENAIISSTITECVNGAQELTLGSVCSNMVEAQLLTPNGALSVNAGDEIAVYRVEDDRARQKVGLFTLEKPTRSSANKLSITAYDRISWLDKDLTQWLAARTGWPYRLYDFARLVCSACGLELLNEELPNGDYQIQKFSADGITGRQLMRWIGEIAGRFCRATPDGQVEFAWYTAISSPSIGTNSATEMEVKYTPSTGDLSFESAKISVIADNGNVEISSDLLAVVEYADGNVVLESYGTYTQLYYFQNSLSYEDYAVKKIEKVQIRQNEEDVGTIYPDDTGEANTYIITGNHLLTALSAEALQPIAKALYEQLKDVSYTPCKVSIPTHLGIQAGDIVKIIDRNGKIITAYIMTRTQSGQKMTLECTGSAKRDSTTVVNNRTYETLAGKVLNLKMDVDGLQVENRKGEQEFAKLNLQVSGIAAEVSRQSAQQGNLTAQL
ncbi:MAG: hypothetical protein E7453_05985, partial [Ruminococcaceae bacterium]|nr:hypothetical protein [Oscillospiraceae bacterium]